MRQNDAAEWYRRGQAALTAGRAEEAAAALRHASSEDPEDRGYSLALASALVAGHHDTSAEQVLRRLRDEQPELPEANLALARLEARRNDVTAATRDYQHALTGLWSSEREDERRGVRLELVRFLLDHDQRSRALSELLVVAVTLPDTPAAHLETGQLFLRAGDAGRALEQFQAVLRQDPQNAAALSGAGEAAFNLADYARARRYLAADSPDPRVKSLRILSDLILEGDPLAPRIARSERTRRMSAGIEQARGALEGCLANLAADAAPRASLESLQAELESFTTQMKPVRGAVRSDLVEDGTDLAYRIERGVESSCGVTAPADRALILIGGRHGLDPQ